MKQSPVELERRRSLFGRGENSTVIMLLVGFLQLLWQIQLIMVQLEEKLVIRLL